MMILKSVRENLKHYNKAKPFLIHGSQSFKQPHDTFEMICKHEDAEDDECIMK